MRKRLYLLTLLAVAVWMAASAVSLEHSYRPFVKEGKIWKAKFNNEVVEYIITGDTTINSLAYKRVYYKSFRTYQDTLRHYYGAVREVDKVVTMVFAGEHDPYRLYDFNLLFNNQTTEYITDGYRRIVRRSTMDTAAGPFSFILFSETVGGWTATMQYMMTEGVGWVSEPFATGPGSYSAYNLIGCYEDGRRIFKHNDHFFTMITTYGDQNGDEKVDIADVNKLLYDNSERFSYENDMNRDGWFTTEDIYILVDFIIGIDVTDR